MPRLQFAIAFLLLALCGGARAQFANAQGAVALSIPPVSVVPPEGAGWRLQKQNLSGAAFERADPVAKYSSTAQVDVIRFAAGDDLAQIQAELARHLPLLFPGLPLPPMTYQAHRTRGYPCVTASADSAPSLVVPHEDRIVSLAVTTVVMACRKNGANPTGFLAAYAHTALKSSAQAKDDATSFLNGVSMKSD